MTNVTQLPVPSFAQAFVKAETVGDPKSMLIYGEPGTRKTSIAGSIVKVPGFKRVLYIDVDNGAEVFVNDPEVHAAVLDDRLQILPVDKTDPNAFNQITNAAWEVIRGDFGYDAVVLDALDVAQEVAVNYFLQNTYNENGKLDSRAAWGQVSKWSSDLMWGFQNAPHFMGITVAHSKLDEDKKTGATAIKPKMQGSVKDNIAGIPSLVAYLEFEKLADEKTHLVAGLGNSEDYISKSRYSATVPDRVVDFDMPTLFSLIRGENTTTAASAA